MMKNASKSRFRACLCLWLGQFGYFGPENADFSQLYFADVLKDGWCWRPTDVVCANILTSVLNAAAAGLWTVTKKRLIRTGIRECEGDGVAEAFLALGAREIRCDGDGEWCGIVLDQGYTARTARSHAKTPRRREFQCPISNVQGRQGRAGDRGTGNSAGWPLGLSRDGSTSLTMTGGGQYSISNVQ